jgi:hypothetical protein
MTTNAKALIPGFMKIGQLVQMLKGEHIDTHADGIVMS